MIALRFVRLIESHSDEIAKSLVKMLHTSSRTKGMETISDADLLIGTHETLRHLSDWLLSKTNAEIEARYVGVGRRLARHGVTLPNACWTLVLSKQCLWDFLQREGFLFSPVELYGEMELLWLLNQFFDRALCYLAEGYERERNSLVAVASNSSRDLRMTGEA